MKPARFTAYALISLVLSASLAGQDDTQPLSPQLDVVTVDPLTGFAFVSWIASASSDVASYVVYTVTDGTANAVDTVRSPYQTLYIHTTSAARYRSVTYVAAAIDSSLNISPLSNSLSTVYLSAENDSCNNRIILAWTPYVNPLHPADRYEIRGAAGNGPVILITTLPFTESSFVFADYVPGTEYCFHVTASGNGAGLSSSNRVCLTTGHEIVPSWIDIQAVTVAGNALLFQARYDPATTMDKFILQQYNSVNASWNNAAGANGANGNVTVSYPGADTGRVGLFRLAIVNSCNVAMASSGSVRNIVLQSAVTGTSIGLRWNTPFPSGGALSSVWRDTGNGWVEVASDLSDTTWTDDYTLFADDVTAAEVAYLVTARSADAPAGAPLHRSSVATLPAAENIFIPNAFTPDRGGENAYFRPEFSFIPSAYEFRIYSRGGVLLFQTTDHAAGWDGRSKGTLLPSGVYLYSLRLTAPSGRTETRRGTVTILP